MQIAYFSASGQVRDFVTRIGHSSTEVPLSNPLIDIGQDFILIVPTYDGMIYSIVEKFVQHGNNPQHLLAVAGSGNKAFGQDYVLTAKNIAKFCNVPMIFDFEFKGTNDDVILFNRKVESIGESQTTAETQGSNLL